MGGCAHLCLWGHPGGLSGERVTFAKMGKSKEHARQREQEGAKAFRRGAGAPFEEEAQKPVQPGAKRKRQAGSRDEDEEK